jgi:hypothetical protein
VSDKELHLEDGEALHTLGGAGCYSERENSKMGRGTEVVKRNGNQKSEGDTLSTIGCRTVVELCLCSHFSVASSVDTKKFTFWFRYSKLSDKQCTPTEVVIITHDVGGRETNHPFFRGRGKQETK